MFILDSLMISGIRWALETALTAAEAEMNDDTVLREQLLEAEMRREMGEISDEEFTEIEADLLARIREIKERREGGSGPLAFGEGEPMRPRRTKSFRSRLRVAGDFYGAGSNSPSAYRAAAGTRRSQPNRPAFADPAASAWQGPSGWLERREPLERAERHEQPKRPERPEGTARGLEAENVNARSPTCIASFGAPGGRR